MQSFLSARLLPSHHHQINFLKSSHSFQNKIQVLAITNVPESQQNRCRERQFQFLTSDLLVLPSWRKMGLTKWDNGCTQARHASPRIKYRFPMHEGFPQK